MLKRRFIGFALVALLATTALAAPAAAQKRLIVRTQEGLDGARVIQTLCRIVSCQLVRALDGAVNQLFLVVVPDRVGSLLSPLLTLLNVPGIVSIELDQVVVLRRPWSDREEEEEEARPPVPLALYDQTPVEYYGSTVRRGYVEQPAVRIISLDDARRAFGVTGAGVVAVIDTGVDPNHPAIRHVLLPGYDFTRNREGASELADISQSTAAMVDQNGDSEVNQSTAAMVDQSRPVFVNQSTAAMVDQSTAAMVDNPKFAAFGHGTMVAGIVHLVAPEVRILPLKAFGADGSGYASDVLRAIYYAAQNNTNVINMSFSFTTSSKELERACNYAARRGLILVASAGNDGRRTVVYPAGLSNVMGVASTDDRDERSDFSNYGRSLVWVAAPGEGIVTTYPLGHYAASWGTSFSTPFVAGTAALLYDVKRLNEEKAALAISRAKWVAYEMGNGRLDVFWAVQAWRQLAGIW